MGCVEGSAWCACVVCMGAICRQGRDGDGAAIHGVNLGAARCGVAGVSLGDEGKRANHTGVEGASLGGEGKRANHTGTATHCGGPERLAVTPGKLLPETPSHGEREEESVAVGRIVRVRFDMIDGRWSCSCDLT
eukprot:352391-Chlamydomonas_euryale.AAC.1